MELYAKLQITKFLSKDQKDKKAIKNIVTKEYPGVATDLQSQLMVLMCKLMVKALSLKIYSLTGFLTQLNLGDLVQK